jgi:hypothetical protein
MFCPRGMSATQSFLRNAAIAWATASNSVAAVTSTECVWPSISRIVTRQDRTCINARYHIRFLFAIYLNRVWEGEAFPCDESRRSFSSCVSRKKPRPSMQICSACQRRSPGAFQRSTPQLLLCFPQAFLFHGLTKKKILCYVPRQEGLCAERSLKIAARPAFSDFGWRKERFGIEYRGAPRGERVTSLSQSSTTALPSQMEGMRRDIPIKRRSVSSARRIARRFFT